MIKENDFVFCVDSDGCAMDTMTYKHQLFFGPLAAQVFNVQNVEDFLEKWDNINLYSRTRGVNRFVGLVMGLEYGEVKGINNLKRWVTTTNSLSNTSLEKEIRINPSDDLEKALEWSNRVNSQIKKYEGPVLSFTGAREGLSKLSKLGKVFVVSSANREAVEEEWREQGLLEFVDDLYCQDRGKKEDVIASLLAEGYSKENLLMIGDSPGDLSAAEQNKVSFYPILVNKEGDSWNSLVSSFASNFVDGKILEQEFIDLKEKFWENLD